MSKDIFEALRAPFDPARVSWRVGSTNKKFWKEGEKRRGQVLAYIDSRDVQDRLDDVMGPENWQNDSIPMPNGTTCCRLELRIDNEWIGKTDGAGATGDTSKESEREMAEKGAYSDALKRAAVLWGIGRYLYALDAPWVDLDDRWNIPKATLADLQRRLPGPQPQNKSAYQARKEGDYPRLEKALRECRNVKELADLWTAEKAAINALPAGWKKSLTDEKDRLKGELTAANADAA